MRSSLLACLLLSVVCVPLFAADDTPAATPATPATTTAPAAPAAPDAAPAAKSDLAIADAIESIVDEDEATRKKAFARLDAATAADLPTLEKYEHATDPEIRRQVGLILQRLRRGEAAFTLKFADGTPAAGQKVTVKLIEQIPPPKTDDSTKQAQAGNGNGALVVNGGAGGAGGQVQIQINGNVGVGQMVVVGNGVQIVGPNGQAMGTQKEVFSGELTADANGKVVLGRFNDASYQYQIQVADPLPRQARGGVLDLKQDSAAVDLELHHGVGATVTVVDADDKPIEGAVVMNLAGNALKMLRGQPPMQLLNQRRWLPSADTDAKGVASFEKMDARELTLVAIKRGYELSTGESHALKDGETLTLTIKLVKSQPIDCTFTAEATDKKPLATARLLFVPMDQVGPVLGNRWSLEANAKEIDTYIQKGAIDAGTTDDDGVLKTKLLQDQYIILAFSKDGTKTWFAQLYSNNAIHEKVTARFQAIQPPVIPNAPGQ